MNSISAMKKSAVAIALALGITPMAATALTSDAKMLSYFPLNESATSTTVTDAMKKCTSATVGSGVTFTDTPTGASLDSLGLPTNVPSYQLAGFEEVPLWGQDSIGTNNDGNTDPYTGPQLVTGVTGYGNTNPRITKVARFSGTEPKITVPDLPPTCALKSLDTLPAYSISAWVRTNNEAPTGSQASGATLPGPTAGTTPILERMGTMGGWQLYIDTKVGETVTQGNGVAYNNPLYYSPTAVVENGVVNRIAFCVKGAASGTTMGTDGQTQCLSYPPARTLNPWNWNDETEYGSFKIRPGWWYNVVVTYAKKPLPINGVAQPQAVMYINGVKVATSKPSPLLATTPPTPPGANPFPSPVTTGATNTIMGKGGPTILVPTTPPTGYILPSSTPSAFKGRLDDVRFYGVALTPDDITELSKGCKPATFDPKTGKVSIPCVMDVAGNAWSADLLALPPVKVAPPYAAVVGSEVGRNLVFNVAAAKPLPLPLGSAPTNTTIGMLGYSGTEYPWGPFVARYSVSNGGAASTWDEYIDLPMDVSDGVSSNASLYIPGVTVPSPISGVTVKDCYAARLYYALDFNRFYMSYNDVDYRGPNCTYAVTGVTEASEEAGVEE